MFWKLNKTAIPYWKVILNINKLYENDSSLKLVQVIRCVSSGWYDDAIRTELCVPSIIPNGSFLSVLYYSWLYIILMFIKLVEKIAFSGKDTYSNVFIENYDNGGFF